MDFGQVIKNVFYNMYIDIFMNRFLYICINYLCIDMYFSYIYVIYLNICLNIYIRKLSIINKK